MMINIILPLQSDELHKVFNTNTKIRDLVTIYTRLQRFTLWNTLNFKGMKFRVFWDVAPCSHVEVDQRFGGAYCLHHQGILMMEAVNFNFTTWRYIPEDSTLHTRCCENLKSPKAFFTPQHGQ
jgi:hypothetical protein